MASSSSSGRHSASLILHINLHEGTCRGGIAILEKKPRIIYTTRAEKRATSLSIFSPLSVVLEEIHAFKIVYGRGLSIDRIFCTFSGSHYTLRTKTIKSVFKEQTLITPALITKLLLEERQGQVIRESNSQKAVSIKINGYPTANPFGKHGKRVEIGVAESVMNMSELEKIRSIVSGYFFAPIVFEPFCISMFTVARNYESAHEDVLCINLENEETELTLIKDSSMVGTSSFPQGALSLLQHLAEHLKTSADDVESSLSLLRANALGKREKMRVEEGILEAKKRWLGQFHRALIALSPEGGIPEKVYVSTSQSHSTLIQGLLVDGLSTSISEKANKRVVFLSADTLSERILQESSASFDPIIAIDTLFATTLKDHIPLYQQVAK